MARVGHPVIVWFREDLRLADNPALHHAAAMRLPVIPVFILDEESPGIRAPGAAQKWMLHHALAELAIGLQRLGAPLILARGAAAGILASLVSRTGACAVYWNRRCGPGEIAIDTTVGKRLAEHGIEARSYLAGLLHEPARLTTAGGGPFKAFSPFWRALLRPGEPRPPLPAPAGLTAYEGHLDSVALASLGLLPTAPDWAGGLRQSWPAGEAGALNRLERFVESGLTGYAERRDLPGEDHVSRLSPYLRWGMISPYQLWQATRLCDAPVRDIEKFRIELGWREFSRHLLFHFPQLHWKNHSSRFDAFPWLQQSPHLLDWKKGLTGYPIVDAGMRELWHTGYMHNRVRMVVASFLVKHLMVDWRVGEAWFWDTLVDGDPANNPANWQWVAGCGADAAPYFRIFNPVLQGRKFDAAGKYVRNWVPEIAALPNRYLHAPWQAPAAILDRSGVILGDTYPLPVVDHEQARARALAAFASIRNAE